MMRPLFPTMNPHSFSGPRSFRTILLGLGLLLALTGGCAVKGPEKKSVEIPAGSFAPQWLADLGLKGDEATEIFVRDELVIVYTRDHFAFVLDRDSGVLKWVVQLSSQGVMARPPVVLKDYIVFPTISTMEVYNRQGKGHRSVQAPGMALRSGAAGLGTRVYFGSDDQNGGRIVCVGLDGSKYQDTSVVWTLQTLSGISATPVAHQGILYTADDSGGVYAVNANSAAAVWGIKHDGREAGVFGTSARIRSDLKADDYGVYVASMDTKLYCIGRTDGRIRWQYFAGEPLLHSPAVSPTTVYQFMDDKGLIAIDKTKGEPARTPKWINRTAIQFLAEDDKYAYLERADHVISAVDKATGEEKFHSRRTDFVGFGTSFKNNIFYAITRGGEVRAVSPVFKAGTFGEFVRVPGEGQVVALVK